MNSDRKAAAIAGWFYILGTVAGILSVAYAVDAPDYLVQAAANANQVLLAAFFHLVMAPAYVGVAIALCPVLRQHHPHLALGFASFRVKPTHPSLVVGLGTAGNRLDYRGDLARAVPSHRHPHHGLHGFEPSHGVARNGLGGMADRQRVQSTGKRGLTSTEFTYTMGLPLYR
jgi:hypothetical protein